MEPTTEQRPKVEHGKPEQVGFRESINQKVIEARRKLGMQEKEFGYDPDSVTFRKDHMHVFDDGYEMGVQADVNFKETQYRQSFDNAFNTLLDFAKAGKEHAGWRITEPVMGGEPDSETYGNYQTVELPNGRKYGVVNETPKDGQTTQRVSIRSDFNREKGEKKGEGGAYYFRHNQDSGEREIEICGAHMEGGVDTVMDDIKQVIDIASQSQSK